MNQRPKTRIESITFAVQGLSTLIGTQPNARIHSFVTACVAAAGFICGLTASEWALVVLAITLVWLAEALNTGFEFVCDVVSPEWNAKVKSAKDIAAGGVLVTAIGSVVIGILVFWPHIFAVL